MTITRKVLPSLLGWLLAIATALVVIGVVAAGLPRVLGLRSEAVSSRLRVPSLAIAQARAEVLPGDLVLFAGEGREGSVYDVLGLQRSGDVLTLILRSPGTGEPLPAPVKVTGKVLVVRMVLPLLGYGDLVLSDPVARWAALLLLAAALVALSFVATKARSARPLPGASVSADRAPPVGPERLAVFAQAAATVAGSRVDVGDDVPASPKPEDTFAREGSLPQSLAEGEGSDIPPHGQSSLEEVDDDAGPGPSPATADPMGPTSEGEGLEGDLLAIFQKVATQVRERTLASEVEDVSMQELVEELRSLRRRLRP